MFFDFQVFGNAVAKCFLLFKSLETLSQNVFRFLNLWKHCRKMFFAFQVFGNIVAKCFLLSKSLETLLQNVFCFPSLWKRCRKMFYRKIIVFCHFPKDFIQKQLFFAIFMMILLRNNCFAISMRILLRNNCFLTFPQGFYLETIVFCHFHKDFT